MLIREWLCEQHHTLVQVGKDLGRSCPTLQPVWVGTSSLQGRRRGSHQGQGARIVLDITVPEQIKQKATVQSRTLNSPLMEIKFITKFGMKG